MGHAHHTLANDSHSSLPSFEKGDMIKIKMNLHIESETAKAQDSSQQLAMTWQLTAEESAACA